MPNELGLYDMSGNVQEWCSDFNFVENSNKKTRKILRGGSWASNSNGCRVYVRDSNLPENSNSNTGFRIAK
jgi:formylglycine-generating enzyme required for sulfatase activity